MEEFSADVGLYSTDGVLSDNVGKIAARVRSLIKP